MRKRFIVTIAISVIFTVVSMYLFSNIVDINTPLMILLSMLVMNIFMMLFSNIWEIVSNRNLKFNIVSAITALDAIVMFTSSLMMWYKTIQLTEAQNSILLCIAIISMVSFFILGTICIRLEKDLKKLSNKFNNEEESEEMLDV